LLLDLLGGVHEAEDAQEQHDPAEVPHGAMVHRSPYNERMAEPRTVLIFGKDT
jgi:hypothetical protein